MIRIIASNAKEAMALTNILQKAIISVQRNPALTDKAQQYIINNLDHLKNSIETENTI